MKLNENFVKHTMDGETVLVPMGGAGFHGLVQGNDSVGVILDCLQNDVTEEEIVAELRKRFKGDERLMREDVADVVRRLKKIGAIDD